MKNVPEVNDKVTIHNINSKYPDRSYQNDLWVVVAINKTHGQLKSVENRGLLPNKILVLLEEYEFVDASSFV